MQRIKIKCIKAGAIAVGRLSLSLSIVFSVVSSHRMHPICMHIHWMLHSQIAHCITLRSRTSSLKEHRKQQSENNKKNLSWLEIYICILSCASSVSGNGEYYKYVVGRVCWETSIYKHTLDLVAVELVREDERDRERVHKIIWCAQCTYQPLDVNEIEIEIVSRCDRAFWDRQRKRCVFTHVGRHTHTYTRIELCKWLCNRNAQQRSNTQQLEGERAWISFGE